MYCLCQSLPTRPPTPPTLEQSGEKNISNQLCIFKFWMIIIFLIRNKAAVDWTKTKNYKDKKKKMDAC